jgi:hypothetical protein
MTITDYISFFEDKPTAHWITGGLVDASGRHCAVGFLRSAKINDSCLQDLLAKHNMPGLVQLNDDYRNRYDDRDFDGPYARLHTTMNTRGRFAISFARPAERFTDGLIKALADQKPFRRRGVGPDASMLLTFNRILPSSGMHHMSRIVLGIPRQGSMRDRQWPAKGGSLGQRGMVLVARVLPQSVLQRLAAKRRKENGD